METDSGQYLIKNLYQQTKAMNLDMGWIDAVLFTPYQSWLFFQKNRKEGFFNGGMLIK